MVMGWVYGTGSGYSTECMALGWIYKNQVRGTVQDVGYWVRYMAPGQGYGTELGIWHHQVRSGVWYWVRCTVLDVWHWVPYIKTRPGV